MNNLLTNIQDRTIDGIQWYSEQLMNTAASDPHAKSESISSIASMLMLIQDRVVRDAYAEIVRKSHKIKVAELKQAIDKIELAERKSNVNHMTSGGRSEEYELPHEVTHSGGKFEQYENEILKYGVFMHKDIIYTILDKSSDDRKYFERVSNFEVQIINHMEDEKLPMRLVRIQSTVGRQRIFDTPYDNFTTRNAFIKMVEGFGNFQYDGTERQYLKLKSKLMDDMGDGNRVTVLGWQDEGYWCFNDSIIYKGERLPLDQYGSIEIEGSYYYVPSGNSIYAQNSFRFLNQKKVVFLPSTKSLDWIMTQGMKVHQDRFHSMMLYTIACVFRDLIHSQLSFFPIPFLYGAASTGKDNLVEFVQCFFGKPQEALVMTGKDNTAKAKIRELAQFKNVPAHFSEYKPEPDSDDMIKKLWDGRGYKRGTIDSAYGVEEVPVFCPLIITSNNYPVDDAVITRLISIEFFETSFTQEQTNDYDLLKDVIKKGISSHLVEFLKLRESFEKQFRARFKEVVAELKQDKCTLTMAPRMLQNIAVLGASYRIAADSIHFPFTYEEWKNVALSQLVKQERKRASGGALSKWWDCFLESVRDKHDPILEEREFRINGTELILNFSQVYARYTQLHYRIYREAGLSKTVLQDQLKKSEAFQETKGSVRMGQIKSSAYVFDLNQIHITDDLLEIISWKNAERAKYANEFSQINSPEVTIDLDDLKF